MAKRFAAVLILMMLTAGAGLFAQAGDDRIPYEDLPRLGSADAPVRVVDFSDFKCPHCKSFAEGTLPLIRNEFISAGIVSFYYMHFPVVGQDSVTAGAAAAAVHDLYGNDAFWSFEKALFENQGAPREAWATPEYLASLAASVVEDADEEELLAAIRNGDYVDVVRRDYEIGRELGVTGTPTLIIGDRVVKDADNYRLVREVIESMR